MLPCNEITRMHVTRFAKNLYFMFQEKPFLKIQDTVAS